MAPLGSDSSELLVIAVDQTRRHAADRANKRKAFADALTCLPNRRALEAKLSELDAEGPEAGSRALLLIDMDRFKILNDTLGHDKGDLMLKEVANRFSHASVKATSSPAKEATSSSWSCAGCRLNSMPRATRPWRGPKPSWHTWPCLTRCAKTALSGVPSFSVQ